jgi:hypothetical protein
MTPTAFCSHQDRLNATLVRCLAPLLAAALALAACEKQAPEEKTPSPRPDRGMTAPVRDPPARPAPAMTPPPTRPAPKVGRSWLYPSMQAGMDPSPSLAGAPTPDPEGLEIKQLVMAKRLEGRKPDGVATEFELTDGTIYCHVEAVNRKGPERKLTVKWFHEGTEFHRVILTVGKGPIWRTWAKHTLRQRHHGSWECTVQNEQDVLIGAVKFTVKE